MDFVDVPYTIRFAHDVDEHGRVLGVGHVAQARARVGRTPSDFKVVEVECGPGAGAHAQGRRAEENCAFHFLEGAVDRMVRSVRGCSQKLEPTTESGNDRKRKRNTYSSLVEPVNLE